MRALSDSVVYAYRVGDFIKIGVSTDLEQRLKDAQTYAPQEIEVLAWGPGDVKLERALHHQFAHARQKGEWFSLSREEIEVLVARLEIERLRTRSDWDLQLAALPPSSEEAKDNWQEWQRVRLKSRLLSCPTVPASTTGAFTPRRDPPYLIPRSQ